MRMLMPAWRSSMRQLSKSPSGPVSPMSRARFFGTDDAGRGLRYLRVDLAQALQQALESFGQVNLALLVEEELLPQLSHLEFEEVSVLGRMLMLCRGLGVVPEAVQGGLADALRSSPHSAFEARFPGLDDAIGIAAVFGDECPS